MDSATFVARAVGRRQVRAVDIVRAALQRAESGDRQFNALTTIFARRALDTARRVDGRVASGQSLPLAGVPFVAKNLFDVRGEVTLAGSTILRGSPPAHRDAAAVCAMEDAGAVLVGASSMDEFAYGFTSENSHYGPVRNPRDTTRTAGGSSGGSAACVAGGIVPLSLGTDTNGSVRVPASLCGIVGFKPGYGRISRAGAYPFVDSLDHVGVFARNIEDAALCYGVLEGAGAQELPGAGAAMSVGVLAGTFEDWSGPVARACLSQAAGCFAHRKTVVPRMVREGRAAAFLMTAYEGGQLHLEHLRSHYGGMEPHSRDRLLAGALMPTSWYLKARAARAAFEAAFMPLFGAHDVLLTAATPVTAPVLGQSSVDINGAQMPVRASLGLLAQPISCLGLPALSVPWPTAGGLPMGIQVIGPRGGEQAVLRAALVLEHHARTR